MLINTVNVNKYIISLNMREGGHIDEDYMNPELMTALELRAEVNRPDDILDTYRSAVRCYIYD